VAHSFAEQYSFPRPIDQDLGKTGPDEIGGEKRRCANKGEEISVVSASDAVVKPHAVMVLRLNAIIAEPAVVGARRSPDVAGAAMPNRDFHGGRRLVCRSNEVPVGRRRAYSERIVVFGRRESVKISWENLANYLNKHERSCENIEKIETYPGVSHGCVNKGRDADIKQVTKSNGNGWRDLMPKVIGRKDEEKHSRHNDHEPSRNIYRPLPRILPSST
jgi:hypothetical protein